MSIRVVLRADAGAKIGTGHFARTSALANALLRVGGCELAFLTNAEGASLASRFFSSEVSVVALEPKELSPEAGLQKLERLGLVPDVLCLDQYGNVPEWELAAAKSRIPLMVLDDLDVAREAEIIVRPHGGPRLPGSGTVLRGPDFLPLAQDLVEIAKNAGAITGASQRLIVCFGGSDPTGEVAKFLSVADRLTDLKIDLVVGPGAQTDASIPAAAERHDNVTLHAGPSREQLAQMTVDAEMALGAGGVMLWERLCLGTPSLIVATAENQVPQIESMLRAGAIRSLGLHSDVTAEMMAVAVADLAADRQARAEMRERGWQAVDGRGAKRLSAWVKALAMKTREVAQEDARDLLDWRTNDANWKHNWDGAEKPELSQHEHWLDGRLADPDCLFRIVTLHDEPVGVVRFDINADEASAYLSIYLVPAWHGKRMGLPAYCAAERALRRSRPEVKLIVSRIHSENAASEQLHRDAGFEIVASSERPDWLAATKVLAH